MASVSRASRAMSSNVSIFNFAFSEMLYVLIETLPI